jgi:hypothetical protein
LFDFTSLRDVSVKDLRASGADYVEKIEANPAAST